MQFLSVLAGDLLLEPFHVSRFLSPHELCTQDDGEPQNRLILKRSELACWKMLPPFSEIASRSSMRLFPGQRGSGLKTKKSGSLLLRMSPVWIVQNTAVILVKRDDASSNCHRVRCGFLLSQKGELEGTDSSIFFALSTQNGEIIAENF